MLPDINIIMNYCITIVFFYYYYTEADHQCSDISFKNHSGVKDYYISDVGTTLAFRIYSTNQLTINYNM